MTDQLVNRSLLKENFTVLPNALLNDAALSGEGLALMVYLLSKPVNWKLAVADIGKRFSWGRDKTYKVIGHLMAVGYIVKEEHRNGGKFKNCIYKIYDTPQISPFPEKPDTVLPDTANQDYIKNRDTINLYKQRTDSNGWFEKFWTVVAHKTAKADCKRKFDRAAKTIEPETIIKAYQAQLAAHKSKGKDADYFRRPLTWLNQRGWEDETPVADEPIRRVKLPDSESDYQKIPIQLVLNKPELREYAKAKGWYRADSPFDNHKEKHG